MAMTGIRPLRENEWSSPVRAGQTSVVMGNDMRKTDSGVKSTNDSVEPSGKTIHNARWRFEWRNLKNNRRFPL
jgi:hypothetical protein